MRMLSLLALVSVLFLAGCADTFRTIELKDGRMTMIEVPPGGRPPRNWELKEVSNTDEVKALRRSGWTLESRLDHAGGADTYLMKRKLIVQKPAPPPPFRPLLITTLGTNTTSDGVWQIGVTEATLDFSYSAVHQKDPGLTYTGSSTVSPDKWKPHPGWCVFVESKSNVWAYDGDSSLLLYTHITVENDSNGTLYSSRFPCPVPPEVFSRLSEPVQNRIQKNE